MNDTTISTTDEAPAIDAAWARVTAALPAGWCISVTVYPPGQWDAHATAWNFNGGVSAGVIDGFGGTPTAALDDLAARLAESVR